MRVQGAELGRSTTVLDAVSVVDEAGGAEDGVVVAIMTALRSRGSMMVALVSVVRAEASTEEPGVGGGVGSTSGLSRSYRSFNVVINWNAASIIHHPVCSIDR